MLTVKSVYNFIQEITGRCTRAFNSSDFIISRNILDFIIFPQNPTEIRKTSLELFATNILKPKLAAPKFFVCNAALFDLYSIFFEECISVIPRIGGSIFLADH